VITSNGIVHRHIHISTAVVRHVRLFVTKSSTLSKVPLTLSTVDKVKLDIVASALHLQLRKTVPYLFQCNFQFRNCC